MIKKSEQLLKESFVPTRQRWRPFCNQFEGLVEDFNYGTLLRLDCQKGYSEENSIFCEFSSSTAGGPAHKLTVCGRIRPQTDRLLLRSQPPGCSSSPSRSPATERAATRRSTGPKNPAADGPGRSCRRGPHSVGEKSSSST